MSIDRETFHTIRHGGLELPVVPTSQVAWDRNAILAATEAPGSSDFVRVVCMTNPAPSTDLASFVRLGKLHLNRAAQLCGGVALLPQWYGISHVPEGLDAPSSRAIENALLPKGFGLVAATDIVQDKEQMPASVVSMLTRGISKYLYEVRDRKLAEYWRDVTDGTLDSQSQHVQEQFTYGIVPRLSPEPKAYLTDTDLYIFPTRLPSGT